MTEEEMANISWKQDTKVCIETDNEEAYKIGFINGLHEKEKENVELKETVMKMNDVITKTFSNLTKAKEILSKLLKEENNNMYWEMNGSDKSSYYKVRKQAEQFINSEVEE